MTWWQLRKRTWIVIVTLAAALLALPAVQLLASTGSGGIVVEPGVIFRPSQGWADIAFATQQRFASQVIVRPTGLTIDNVFFDIEKLPRGLPRALVTITDWAPAAGNGSAALGLLVSSEANTTVWFNASGLRRDAVYEVHVDGALQTRSATPGEVSFSWSAWSIRNIAIRAYVDTTPPVADAGPDRDAAVNQSLTFDGSNSRDDTTIVRYEWSFGDGSVVAGPVVDHAFRASGQYPVTLTVWDAVGNAGSDTVSIQVGIGPALDSVPPGSVGDLRLVGLGPDFALLEWTAPGDDGALGVATVYDLRVSPVGTPEGIDFGTAAPIPTGPPGPAGTLERANATGLEPDTLYWFALRVGDEVPNWSPPSNILEVLTAHGPPNSSAAQRPPAVNGVWYDPGAGQVDVIFSKSMNRTSVETAILLGPNVTFDATWVNDAHLQIVIHTELVHGATYLLAIDSAAVDRLGNPLATGFAYRFVGVRAGEGAPSIAGLPLAIAIPLIAGLAGTAAALTIAFAGLGRTQRKLRQLRMIILAQARRIKDLRGGGSRRSDARVPAVPPRSRRK